MPMQKAVSGGREKVAGNIIKQAVFMLGGADIVQPLEHGGQQGFVVIKLRLGVAVNRADVCDAVQGVLLHINAVWHYKRAVIGAVYIQILCFQMMSGPSFGVPDHLLIMVSHVFASRFPAWPPRGSLRRCQALPARSWYFVWNFWNRRAGLPLPGAAAAAPPRPG